MVFQQKRFKCPVRALVPKSYKNHRNLMNSAKSNDFMSPRGAPAILLSCAQGTNPMQKNTTRATCAHRRARMISLTDFLNFCARGLPHRPCHHHRDHVPHRRMDIIIVGVVAISGAVTVRAAVLFNIAVVGAIFIIVADVVDVILSSRTSDHRR